jgi:hypothetical protein
LAAYFHSNQAENVGFWQDTVEKGDITVVDNGRRLIRAVSVGQSSKETARSIDCTTINADRSSK